MKSEGHSDRNIMKATSATLAGGAGGLELLRASYLRRVGELAEAFRPRFEAGEFRGFRPGDDEEGVTPPRWRLEAELERREVPSDAAAYVVLACSPSEARKDGGAFLSAVRNVAAEALARDVFRVGLAAGWYAPQVGEEPSPDELALP